MNKKTGEFSAADLKKPTGRKEPKSLGPGQCLSFATPGRFVCVNCKFEKPDSELGHDNGNNGKKCAACWAKVGSIIDGSYRYNGATFEAIVRGKRKTADKKYKSGRRLPKWMFT